MKSDMVSLAQRIYTHSRNLGRVEGKGLAEGRCTFEHAFHLIISREVKVRYGLSFAQFGSINEYTLTFVTLAVSKERSWLKADAPANMPSIFVADPNIFQIKCVGF